MANNIDILLKKYCPNGVQRVKLGDVCKMIKGKSLNKAACGLGDCPIILYGELYTTYYLEIRSVVSSTSIDIARSATPINYGDLLLPLSSTTKEAQIGNASVYISDSQAFLGGDAMILRTEQNPKYLTYLLNSSWFEPFKMQCVHGTTIMHLHPKELLDITIPLPPLPVQEEIVRILDAMTALVENIDKEINNANILYKLSRSKLLNLTNVARKKICELFILRGGYTPSTQNKDFWTDYDGYPWFKMEDIRDKGRILSDSYAHITKAAIKGGGLFPAGTIIIATSATIGEHAILQVPALSNQRFTALINKSADTNMKFYYYYGYILGEWCRSHTIQGNFAGVDMAAFRNFEIPIPPLDVQQSIVDKLDTFEALIQNLKAERELRQKQYEYYREKLLTFPS